MALDRYRRTIIKINHCANPVTYTDYNEPLERFHMESSVWEGDAWLMELWRTHEYPFFGDMPEHQRLLAAAVETFPGLDYSLHLIPAGQGLPRPQENQWVIYAPGRVSESSVYPDEQQARRALYATVAHEVLAQMPFSGRDWWGRIFPIEDAGMSVLAHVEYGDRLVGFGGIASYGPGNEVVFGLMNGEPFAVNLNDQPDDTLARQILTERLGGVMLSDAPEHHPQELTEHHPRELESGEGDTFRQG